MALSGLGLGLEGPAPKVHLHPDRKVDVDADLHPDVPNLVLVTLKLLAELLGLFRGATLVDFLLISALAGPSRAMKLIPSIGFTKAMEPTAGPGKLFGGLALRASLLPFLSAEGGIAYRQDSFANGDLKLRTWPVTASLWVTPIPVLYAGGGVGWYRTSYDYQGTSGFSAVAPGV